MCKLADPPGDVRALRAAAGPAAPWTLWARALAGALVLHGAVLQAVHQLMESEARRAWPQAVGSAPVVHAVQLRVLPMAKEPVQASQPVGGAAPHPALEVARTPPVVAAAQGRPGQASAHSVLQPPRRRSDEPVAAQGLVQPESLPRTVAADEAPLDDAEPPLPSSQALQELAQRPLPRYAASPPDPFRLLLALRRGAFQGEGELRFEHGAHGVYQLQLNLPGPARPMWEQSSTGRLGASGLEPERFADRRRGRRIGQAQFDREQAQVRFSGRAPPLPLAETGQDRLSWLIQLSSVLRADPALQRAGAQVWLPVYSARGDLQLWRFEVQGERTLTLEDSVELRTWLLTRTPDRAYDTQVEVWLDPVGQFLPARIQLTHWPSGDRMELSRREAAAGP